MVYKRYLTVVSKLTLRDLDISEFGFYLMFLDDSEIMYLCFLSFERKKLKGKVVCIKKENEKVLVMELVAIIIIEIVSEGSII